MEKLNYDDFEPLMAKYDELKQDTSKNKTEMSKILDDLYSISYIYDDIEQSWIANEREYLRNN